MLYRLIFALTLVGTLDLGLAAQASTAALSDSELEKIQHLVPDSPKLKQTLDRLKKRARDNSKDVEARLLLAKAHLSLKEYDEGIAVLKTINADKELRALVILEKAYELKPDALERIRALELLKKALPNSIYVLNRLGEAYFLGKNTPKAIEALHAAVKLAPENRQAYFQLLDIYEKSKNNYESRVLLNDMIQVFHDDVEVYTRLCQTYSNSPFLEEAIDICSRAIELKPNIAENHVNLGLARKYFKQPEQAEKVLKKAAQQFPRSELAQVTAGQLNEELKNYEAARRNYSTCVKAHAQSGRCWLGYAKMSFETIQYKDALAAFRKACKLDVKSRMEFRNSIATLRIKNQSALADEYNKAFESCGLKSSDE